MRPSLTLYVATVIGAAVVLLAHAALKDPAIDAVPIGLIGFWIVLSLAAECFWLETPTGNGMVSTALAINMAMLFVLSLPYALAIGALSVGVSDLLIHRRVPLKALFNAAQTTIALAASFALMRLMGSEGSSAGGAALLQHPWPTLAAPIAFFFINTFLVAAAISLQTRVALWATWRANYGFGYQVLTSAVLVLLGLTLVMAYNHVGYIAGLFYLLFFYFVRDAYHRYVRERRLLVIAHTSD